MCYYLHTELPSTAFDFADLVYAFYTVNHQVLLDEIAHNEMHGTYLTLFGSYMYLVSGLNPIPIII